MSLLTASDFRAVISGRRQGIAAVAARAGLALAEIPYSLAMRRRNRRFDRGLDVHRVGAAVVSVGNLTLGGTGKTPLVEWIARWYRARGVRVALVSRGYGGQAGGRNDEALELEERLPDVPHVQNRDRLAAARLAIEEFESQLILLDDGFQHRRLARDLDIVVVDALEPFGYEHVFPRGTLREPLEGIARADVVVLSRADLVEAEMRGVIQRRINRHAPSAAWVESRHAPRELRSASGRRQPLESLTGPIAAFCGIGNPLGFRRCLEDRGFSVVGFREFPDHHRYTRADVDSLAAWSKSLAASALVTTHKDLVKLQVDQIGACPTWALVIEIEFLSGSALLEARLAPFVPLAGALPGGEADRATA
jgi:tetraacyldisaccharide 4'-kinase